MCVKERIHEMLSTFARYTRASPLRWETSIKNIVITKNTELIEYACTRFANEMPIDIRNSVRSRQYEFVLGRIATQLIFSELGADSSSWMKADERRPIWPPNIVGSISHSSEFVWVAACNRTNDRRSLGIDVEALEHSEEAIRAIAACFCATELVLLSQFPHGLVIGFSAKEALFKCLNPLCGFFIDFCDAEIVALDANHKTFEILLLRDFQRVAPKGTRICGQFNLSANHVWAGLRWSNIFY